MLPLWLPAQARIAILGAEGWFGRTAQALLGASAPTLRTGSIARDGIHVWDEQVLREFHPTIVLNFAFLTRERELPMGTQEYQRANSELTEQFLQLIQFPSVTTVVTISSGAAISEPETTYGRLKLIEEQDSLARSTPDRSVVVGRAFSVSGPYVRRPQDYAFSDFVSQAVGGEITVKADRPTFRRYVAASDFIEVCLRSALSGRSGVIESGGPLIEMGQLAQEIAALVNPGAHVRQTPHTSKVPSTYASDNSSWSLACAELHFTPMDLEAQILAVAKGLNGSDRYDESDHS